MTRPFSLRTVPAFAALFALILAGCEGSSSGVPVSGSVKLPDPLKLVGEDAVNVAFIPEGSEEGLAVSGQVKADQPTFILKTSDGSDVPPGKYKVEVRFEAYPSEKPNPDRNAFIDDFNSKYAGQSTPLTYEVKSGGGTVTIDTVAGTIE